MGELVRLQPQERLLHDGAVIAALYRNLGAVAAERMIRRSLAELSRVMAELAAQMRQRALRDLPGGLQRLRQMAETLGMTSLVRAAGAAKSCLERADSTGFAATWARLMRIAKLALQEVAGNADLSG